jgi:putative zinc finger/helix-turn-helix YgiT family protein
MKMLCTNCEKEVEFTFVQKKQTFCVRKEPVEIDVDYLVCPECHDEVLSPDHDPFVLAYRIYREKHGFLQPEQIKNYRDNYKLSQGEFAKLLNLGLATISRYENGALQDASHDTLLRLTEDPMNLLKLISESDGIFTKSRKEQLVKILTQLKIKTNYIETCLQTENSIEPNVLNGFREFNLDKFYNAILFLCQDGPWKTKLNKLMFYVDFKHFKNYSVSVTGSRYAHVSFGPAPDMYDLYYSILKSRGEIRSEEVVLQTGDVGEKIWAIKNPDLNVFSSSELNILTEIKIRFEQYSASAITKASHEEIGYQETKNGDIISYEFAKLIKI